MLPIINRLLVASIVMVMATNMFAQDRLSSGLYTEISTNDAQGVFEVYFLLSDRVDFDNLETRFKKEQASVAQRAQGVVAALKDKSSQTQPSFIADLKTKYQVPPASIRSFWVNNAVFAEATKATILELAKDPRVEFIGLNGSLIEVESYTSEGCSAEEMLPIPNGREPGITAINAHKLWEMGYTGYGQTAFTHDTGVDPTHPQLKYKYKGFYQPDGSSWFDARGSERPFDCSDHGTHVSGTMVGLDRVNNDTIGVAFNALWVGGATLCGIGTDDNVEAFEWALDPDGDTRTTDDIPTVVNNSWRDPSIDDDCTSIYVDILVAMDVAGLATVFSAGNEGPDVQTITPPHNINIDLVNTFAVGALNGNTGSLPIADFSSRGPSNCFNMDSSLLIKPEVSAPGVQVRSSVPGGLYDNFNGTSMAAPHVSGAIMLLKEAFPYLMGRDLKLALYFSARDIGPLGEDNDYGMGIIDVLAAYNYLLDKGHTPVVPVANQDILLVSVEINPFHCDQSITAYLTVENGGTDTLTAFQTDYWVGNDRMTYEWTGTLAPGERINYQLPALTTALQGTHDFWIDLNLDSDLDDDRPLNDRYRESIIIESRPSLQLSNPTDLDAPICLGQETEVLVNYDGPHSLLVNWYTQPFGGDLLETGNPLVYAPNTNGRVYASSTFLIRGGKDTLATDLTLAGETAEGIQFDVFESVRLHSVRVYSEESGFRIIALLDQNGEGVTERLVNISGDGWQEVELNLDLPVGNNYQLVRKGGKPLGSTTMNAQFPYTIEGLVRLDRTLMEPRPSTQVYRYFFDWEIEYQDPCGRVPFDLEILDVNPAPEARFTASATTIDLSLLDSMVTFVDESTGASDFHWNFGDGSVSTLQNPEKQYTTSGNYPTRLTILSDEGCLATTTENISVIESIIVATRAEQSFAEAEWQLFPNPTTGQFNLRLIEGSVEQLVSVEVFNSIGQLCAIRTPLTGNLIAGQSISIHLGDLPKGLYWVVLNGPNAQKTPFKVSKQ